MSSVPLRRAVEAEVGHPINHALIQLYREGNDFISEHADKTLDVVAGSSIVNFSLGASRTMVLAQKRSESPHPSARNPHLGKFGSSPLDT